MKRFNLIYHTSLGGRAEGRKKGAEEKGRGLSASQQKITSFRWRRDHREPLATGRDARDRGVKLGGDVPTKRDRKKTRKKQVIGEETLGTARWG